VKSTHLRVDAREMTCPMPLLKLKQALNKLEVGQQLHLIATDLTSKRDLTSYINMTDHQMSFKEDNDELHFYVIKG